MVLNDSKVHETWRNHVFMGTFFETFGSLRFFFSIFIDPLNCALELFECERLEYVRIIIEFGNVCFQKCKND